MTASLSFQHRLGPDEIFSAGGTLKDCTVDGPLSEAHRLRLWAEFGSIYVGLPLPMRVAVFDYRVPLFYALRPVLAVYLEHVLWGWLVFTIGLGVYFFTGVKNPAW